MLKTQAGDIIGNVPSVKSQTDAEVFLTRREAAEYLRVSVPTLERWAQQGTGPRVRTFGQRKVFYTLRDLREYAGVEAA